MLTRATLLALSLSACTTTIIQEVEVDNEQGGSSWPNTPDAGESTTGEDIEGSSSTGEGSTSGADAGSTTGEAGSSSSSGSTGAPIEGSTTDDASSTGGSSSTGEQPIEEGTSTSGEPIDQTTGGESSTGEGSTSTGEPEPPPPPAQCEQLDPGACGVGLCFAPAFLCSGDESFLPGGNLQPGEAQVVPGNAKQQRVVHVLDLPAGPVNAVVTPLTGGTQVDYRLYTATGALAAAGSSAGVMKIGIEAAAPAVYLLVIGEVLAKPMTHEVKIVTVPTKQHNDLCDSDAQCLSNFCRASAFDAAPRCLTPCTRASVLDCANKGLPGLCVETGVDKTLLCAGNHKLQVEDLYDNKVCAVNNVGACSSNISDANDVDVWLINGSNTAGSYYARWGTASAFGSKLKGVWLDGSGAVIGEKIVPTNGSAQGPLRPAKSWTWLLLSSADGTTNGFGLTPYTP